MIAEIINTLRQHDFYGAGEFTEIAKGKNEMITSLKGMNRKIRRVWQSRK